MFDNCLDLGKCELKLQNPNARKWKISFHFSGIVMELSDMALLRKVSNLIFLTIKFSFVDC